MKKVYSSTKLGFSIHRPSTLIPVLHQGREMFEKTNLPPIEFKNGSFETSDPEIQKCLKEHNSFGKDFVDTTQVMETAEREVGEVKTKLKPLEGITNRNKAIQALSENGVDPNQFDRTTNKDAIIQIAKSAGFDLVGW